MIGCSVVDCPHPSEFVVGTATSVDGSPHWHVCRDHVARALVTAFDTDPERGALVVEDDDDDDHHKAHDIRRN